ncbi:MAG: B12-binding domain-containing protein, partial [Christensenellaceae bacterium]
MSVYEELSTLVQQGRANNVKELIAAELEKGTGPKELLNDGLLTGMSIIGEKFKNNEVYVPEVLIAARAMQAGIDALAIAMSKEEVEQKGKVVLGTVKGDLHDIGKN